MKKFYVFVSVLFLLLASTIGCSNKEINLITNIDFELSLSNEDSGFVQDSLPTTIILTPERTNYPGFSYYINYKVMEGEGYYLTEDDTEVPAETDILVSKEEDFTANWKYIGTTAGEHKITINGRDNFEKTKVATMQYEIKPINLIWEALSPQTMAKINDTIPLTLRLENTSGAPLTFENTIKIEEGAGLVLDADKKAITLNRALSIDEGVLSLFYVGAAAGQNIVRFDLDVSNASKKTTQVSFDIKEELKNEPPVAVIDTISTTVAKPIVIDVLMNDTDPEDDVLTITTVTEPANGTAIIENGMVVYTPNNAFVGNEPFSYTIMDVAGNEATGEIRVVVKMRETLEIPDRNFEEALIALGHDDVVDQKMFRDVAEGIESLDVSNKNIANLKGIEGFVNLKLLKANENQLSAILVDELVNLVSLDIGFNKITNINLSENKLLEVLNVEQNKLSSLDTQNNLKIKTLITRSYEATEGNNVIPNLKVEHLRDLETFVCFRNGIVELDLTKNTALKVFECGWNPLKTIDLKNNVLLEKINLGGSPVGNIEVSNLINLTSLSLYNIGMTELDVSKNLDLEHLAIPLNKITTLDISNNRFINNLTVSQNDLTSLDVSHIDVKQLVLKSTKNPDLVCIQVSNLNEANARADWEKDTTAFYREDCSKPRETVAIPDRNFEEALIALGHDDVVDQKMFRDVAEGIESLDVSQVDDSVAEENRIQSLEGIEAFISLTNLEARFNALKTVDISKNLLLDKVDFESNRLTELDVSKNTKLTWLSVFRNQLPSLNISQNTNLVYLDADDNNLTTIELSKNEKLETLGLNENKLKVIDLTTNTRLKSLSLGFRKPTTNVNVLTSVDVSRLLDLELLSVNYMQDLTSVDLSANKKLMTVFIKASGISSLDLSNNPAITRIDAANCSALETVNIRNGSNALITEFTVAGSVNLSCIQVDNRKEANANTNWKKDAAAFYSEDCSKSRETIAIPDDNFEETLIALGYDEGALDDVMFKDVAESVISLNLTDKGIKQLSGIESFTSLESLRANKNQLTTIDLTQNKALKELFLDNNQLTTIDVSKNTGLEVFWIKDNQLTSIDLKDNVVLETLSLTGNSIPSVNLTANRQLSNLGLARMPLASIDLSANTELVEVWISNARLTTIDVSNLGSLKRLRLYGNQLTELNLQRVSANLTVLDVTNNSALECIQVDNRKEANANTNWKKDVTAFYSEDCSRPRETVAISDSNFEKVLFENYGDDALDGKVYKDIAESVTVLDISDLGIANLTGIEGFTNLIELTAKNNNLTTVDISKNTKLKRVTFKENKLTTLDLSKNLELEWLELWFNEISSIDVSKNTALKFLDVDTNNLTAIDVRANVNLTELYLFNNKLTEIDLSQNTNLEKLQIGNRTGLPNDNALTTLNMKGHNGLIQNDMYNMSSLSCIEVDDVAVAEGQAKWAKDATANYSTQCE